ncbi:MAG: TetR/AcrR family transcriptional regulator [Candidatus Dormibacteria bacterium]
MSPRGNVRSNMVAAALRLLAKRGVEGTSFKDVLAVSEAPRGSVYHHFPGGKSELVHAALDAVSERGLAAMERTRGQPAAQVLEKFLDLWRQLLDRSHLQAGCAVVAVTVAAPDGDLLDHAGEIFRVWGEQLTDLFVAGGVEETEARRLSTLAIAATEGAVILARARRSWEPFDAVSSTLLERVPTRA